MKLVGDIVVYIIIACSVVGGLASIFKPESELGKQFMEGLNAIGSIFLPVAGIMAASPLIASFITQYITPVFSLLNADPAIAATTILAVDMGGYPLAASLAQTSESWIMATTVGYMAGATIVFSIPVALKIVNKKFHKQLSLGIMIGFITIPIGVLISNLIIMISSPAVRATVSTDVNAATTIISLSLSTLFFNLLPLILICLLLAFGLWKRSDLMIKGFQGFAVGVDAFTKIVFLICVIQMFTGLLSFIPLDPILADGIDPNRALEVAGSIGIMLTGAFPMVYLIQKYLEKPLETLGEKVGLSPVVATGILAASANVIALFSMINDTMKDYEIIAVIAFSVCGAFLIGDHLAFTANFQPSLIVPVMLGKLSAGLLAAFIATKVYKKHDVLAS